jgi:hypothetical protein
MDGYKDETVLKQGSKGKQAASKGSKGKDRSSSSKKKSSRPDTRENVREHVGRSHAPSTLMHSFEQNSTLNSSFTPIFRISNCVVMHIQLVGETGKSPVPLSEDEIFRCFRLWMRNLIPLHEEALSRLNSRLEYTQIQDF